MYEASVLRLFLLVSCSSFVFSSDFVEQSGTFSVGTSDVPSASYRVAFKQFPAFDVAPTVYSWVRNGLKGNGEFHTQVTSVDVTGFDVTISRYDVPTAGWDWSPNLEWDAQIQTEAVSMPLSPSESSLTMTIHVTFTVPYATVPVVNAWVRGFPQYPDTFTTQVKSVDKNGYDVTIRRNDNPTASGWSQNPTLYWTAKELTPELTEETLKNTTSQNTTSQNTTSHPITESESTLGTYSAINTYDLGSPLWVFTPALTDDNAGNYDVIGREVYMSTVRQLLVENSQGNFPLTQTTSSKSTMTLTVRGDTVYIDQPTISFQGLKSLTIKARKIVSNDGTLFLQAPAVCETMDGSQCYYLAKAAGSSDGKNGKNGIASPTVDIFVHEIEGNVNVVTQASNGNVAEEGGDGYVGVDNQWETAGLSNDQSCNQKCGELFGELYYWGYPGPDGENGGDAGKAGASGNGGNAGAVTMFAEKVSGYISMKQLPGTGGSPVDHGFGGRGGYGGTGGCGRRCRAWLMCILIICWPECTSDVACDHRGPAGQDGTPGLDGFKEYPVPTMGKIGNINSASVRTVNSLKTYFENDPELLAVIQRHGESLFQRNDNAGASDVFNFLLSVTSETSAINQEVSLKLEMINQGFDYYGHTEQYAPDLDWSYLSTQTDSLIATGKAFEDSYNSVMNKVQDVVMVSQAIQTTANAAISLEDRELANNQVELESAKNLYVKSLRQLERTMKSEVLQINVLVPLVIVQDKVQELLSGIPALIGGIAGFVDGIIHLNAADAFNAAAQVLDVLFGGPECDAPTIKEAALTLQERLDFGYEFKKINPEDLDFSTIDASAVPIIMLSDLAKNKELLVQELECLYDNPDSGLVQDLERVINDFYRDAALRIALIDRIMNIDVQLKQIIYNRGLLAEAQTALDSAAASAEGSVAIEVKRSFSDLMFSLYQEEENVIMRSLYELSKAYQFSCLWDFDVMSKYVNYFSDQVMTTSLGQLQGIFELQLLRQELEDQRSVFLNLISSSAGPSSHTFNGYWEFTEAEYPDIIEQLHNEGQFSFVIDVDPNDVTTTGCQDCYNGRLVALYIELDGATQESTVPNTVYIKVSHMGDSYFLVPEAGGAVATTLLQQTPENVDGGHVMSFDQSNPVASTQDPTLDAKFLKAEYKFCENSNEFFGVKPCKSPYATYVVTVPRNDQLVCSLDPNDAVSGTNCQDLDFTKFTSVKVYAKVKSWSDYPIQPSPAAMAEYVKVVRMAREQQ